MIPLMLDFSAKRVLLFGAGTVGVRKARHFTGCRLTVVSRTLTPEILSLPQTSLKQMEIADADDDELSALIAKHDFILAATSDHAVNDRITALAKTAGKWYNSATGDSSFLLPSTVSGEEYVIAISTSGAAPAVPRFIRTDLEERFKGLDAMIRLQRTLRTHLKTTLPSPEQRAEVLRAVLRDEAVWQACRENKPCDDLIARYL